MPPKKLRPSTPEPPISIEEEDEKEIKKTEAEIDIEEKEVICVVHKGPITGSIYLCPKCKTYYCQKCALALKEKGEKCWSCEEEFKL